MGQYESKPRDKIELPHTMISLRINEYNSKSALYDSYAKQGYAVFILPNDAVNVSGGLIDNVDTMHVTFSINGERVENKFPRRPGLFRC